MTKKELIEKAFKYANEEAIRRGTFDTGDLITFAYNQALEDAAENAEVEYWEEGYYTEEGSGSTCIHSVDKGSILKLKKQ